MRDGAERKVWHAAQDEELDTQVVPKQIHTLVFLFFNKCTEVGPGTLLDKRHKLYCLSSLDQKQNNIKV